MGSFAARRAKTKDGFCPILIHIICFSAATRHIPVAHPSGQPTAVQNRSRRFCLYAVLPYTYVQDVLYAGFAGAKAGHAKILINSGPFWY